MININLPLSIFEPHFSYFLGSLSVDCLEFYCPLCSGVYSSYYNNSHARITLQSGLYVLYFTVVVSWSKAHIIQTNEQTFEFSRKPAVYLLEAVFPVFMEIQYCITGVVELFNKCYISPSRVITTSRVSNSLGVLFCRTMSIIIMQYEL